MDFRPLLRGYHELRFLAAPALAQVDLLDAAKQPWQKPVPAGAVICMEGSMVWRAKTREESADVGTRFIPLVRDALCGGQKSMQIFGYCVSKKMNSGYIHRSERLLNKNPDMYYDDAAAEFVERYLAPHLVHDGRKRSVNDVAKDLRISLVVHSYNEFPTMVENALRDRLAHEGFTREEQQKIMSQCFVLELGCYYRPHAPGAELPGFTHIEVMGVNDMCGGGLNVQEAVRAGKPLWGDVGRVDEHHNAGLSLGPDRVLVVVKTPETVERDGEVVENPKNHGFHGYMQALPPQVTALAKRMIAAETLTGGLDFTHVPAAQENDGECSSSRHWGSTIRPVSAQEICR